MNQELDRTNPENRDDSPNYTLRRLGALAVVLAALVTGNGLIKSAQSPRFSEATKIYIAQPGGSVWAAAETVKGVDSVGILPVVEKIEEMPANTETLSDGLRAGETLVVPVEVTAP